MDGVFISLCWRKAPSGCIFAKDVSIHWREHRASLRWAAPALAPSRPRWQTDRIPNRRCPCQTHTHDHVAQNRRRPYCNESVGRQPGRASAPLLLACRTSACTLHFLEAWKTLNRAACLSTRAHIGRVWLGCECHPPRSSKTRPLTLRRLRIAAHAVSASFLRHLPAFLLSACAIAPRTRLPCKSPAPTGVPRTIHRACRNSFNVCKSTLRHQCTPQLLHFFALQTLACCFWHGEVHFALPDHVSVLPAGCRPLPNLPDAAVPII
jgi:hypothetical protein